MPRVIGCLCLRNGTLTPLHPVAVGFEVSNTQADRQIGRQPVSECRPEGWAPLGRGAPLTDSGGIGTGQADGLSVLQSNFEAAARIYRSDEPPGCGYASLE